MILFLVIYGLNLVIHIFVTKLSAKPSTLFPDQFTGTNQYYNLMFALNITVCILAGVCWCILIQNTTSQTTGEGIDRVFSSVATNLFLDEVDEADDLK